MPIENVRTSQKAKDQLIKLKRNTGVQNWNTLCRWAFCISLSDASIPSPIKLPADGVEMTWETFGGERRDVYWALLKQRCHQDGFELDEATLNTQFRLHLHRGIGYMASNESFASLHQGLALALTT